MIKVKIVRDINAEDFAHDLEQLLNEVGPASVQYRPSDSEWEALVIWEEKKV